MVGGVVYFSPPLQNLTTTYHQSHWYCGSSLKVAIHEYGRGVRYLEGPFKDRLELFPNNTLKISCLQKNDSNTYSMYMEDMAGKEYYYSVYLKVYGEPGRGWWWSWHPSGDRAGCDIPVLLADVVPKPTVRAIVNRDNPEHCDVTLECWVQLEDVTYEWMPPSRVIPVGSNSTSSTLPLSFNPSLETYTCRASNPVSSSSAQLTRRHPCSWTGTGCTRWQNLGEMGGRWLPRVPGVRSLFPWAGGGRSPLRRGPWGWVFQPCGGPTWAALMSWFSLCLQLSPLLSPPPPRPA